MLGDHIALAMRFGVQTFSLAREGCPDVLDISLVYCDRALRYCRTVQSTHAHEHVSVKAVALRHLQYCTANVRNTVGHSLLTYQGMGRTLKSARSLFRDNSQRSLRVIVIQSVRNVA